MVNACKNTFIYHTSNSHCLNIKRCHQEVFHHNSLTSSLGIPDQQLLQFSLSIGILVGLVDGKPTLELGKSHRVAWKHLKPYAGFTCLKRNWRLSFKGSHPNPMIIICEASLSNLLGLNWMKMKCLDMFFYHDLHGKNAVQVTFTDIAEVVEDDLLNVYHLSSLG